MRVMHRTIAALALVSVLTPLAGCDKRSRKTGASSLLENETSTAMGTTNVYRFVGVEQSLGDARRAAQEERWEDAIAACEALLAQQPGNTEAQSLRNQARLELPNRAHYSDFVKAASANEAALAVKNYRLIAEGSLYRDKARVQLEKLRQSFVDNQENDERQLARLGRCDDARRVARVVGELFPDARGHAEDLVAGCKPARGEPTETAAKDKNEKGAEQPGFGVQPVATAAVAQPSLANELNQRAAAPAAAPAPTPTPAAEPPRLAMAAPTTIARPAPPPAPAAPSAPPKNVPPSELEGLREAGEPTPTLPAGARMIAHRDGVKRVTLALKFCVSESGVPTNVNLVKASDYTDANEKVVADVRRWRFRPYVANGAPVPVCTAALLNYAIE
jgi:hypothetical protein